MLVPFLVFALFLTLGLFSQDLIRDLGSAAVAQARFVLIHLVEVGIWLTGAFLVVRVVNVFLWDRVVARAMGAPVPRLLKDCLAVLVFLVALSGILSFVFEQSVAGVWATSSVAGLVLGFALRSVILDVFTGLAVHLDRSYQIGDWIELHGAGFREPVRGEVIQINWRTTRVKTTARNVIVIPNGVLATVPIVNLSLPTDTTRFKLAITLDAAVPPERATRVLLAGVTAAMGGNGLLEDPDPSVLLDGIAADGVRYEVRYYQDCTKLAPMKGKDRVLRSLLQHLERAGISPAYPKQDVFHAPMPERNLSLKSAADRVGLLARIDLFDEALQLRELEELAREMPLRQYRTGDILLREGEPGDSMFVLSEGLLGASVKDKWGESVQVARIAPGQAFGEMSLFTGEPRSATVTALTDAVAFEVSKAQFQALLARRPGIAERIAGLVALRRVASNRAREGASAEAQKVDAQTLTQQILGRIRSFFGFEAA